MRKITNHSNNICSYSATPDGATVAYVAASPEREVFDKRSREQGLIISTESLTELLSGRLDNDSRSELFVKSGENGERIIPIRQEILTWSGDTLDLSPDGSHIVVKTYVDDVPSGWEEYQDKEMRRLTAERARLHRGQHSDLSTYILIDVATGQARALLNAPLSGNNDSRALWSPDGHSIVVTDTYLPLTTSVPEENEARQSKSFAVEIDLTIPAINKISSEELQVARWEKDANRLVFLAGGRWAEGSKTEVSFRKNRRGWERVDEQNQDQSRPQIILEQDMNTLPRIFAIDSNRGRKTLLLDLNPQFRNTLFGRVESIRWVATDGHERAGGLYYPVGFRPGKKYPLVIQNHGFQANEFEIGPGYSGFAAQPLAGKGIMVLQVGWNDDPADASREAESEMAVYEGAIDYLDKRGLIERNHVGISGFSRTCLHVKYALTHSRYHFAAAAVTDGVDAGYFQYIVFGQKKPGMAQNFEELNGGPPFGEGLISWTKKSPGFNVDKVHTPIRITALTNTHSLLGEWEWFAALTHLQKPVELVVLQDGAHVLQKPWERMISQQGNVDWLCFWLKGEEDPDSTKAEQYVRWRELRKLQEQNETKSKQADSAPPN